VKQSPYNELLSLGSDIGTLKAEIDIATTWQHERAPISSTFSHALKFSPPTALNPAGAVRVDCAPTCGTCAFLSERRARLTKASQRYRELERLITANAVRRALNSGNRDPKTERNQMLLAEAKRLREKGIIRGIPAMLKKKKEFKALSERQIRAIINSEVRT